VVDNRPAEGGGDTRALVEAQRGRYVAAPQPGANRARNLGVRMSETPYLAFLDDDAVPEPSWLREIAVEFADPQVMVVAGRVLPVKHETDAERFALQIGASVFDQPERTVIHRSMPDWFERAAFGGVGIGCNMAFRRAAFDVWPGFHETMDRGTPMYGHGENQAFLALATLGYRIVYTPRAVVQHPLPVTFDALRHDQQRDLSAFTAFVTLLLVEQPQHRGAILRYMRDSLTGKRREWRWRSAPATRLLSRGRQITALLRGPIDYFRSRRQARALDRSAR
jgi:cellulose synthase/poly-beta-1,6-N-acetylglucosamine synthase-like glycosyltransferase